MAAWGIQCKMALRPAHAAAGAPGLQQESRSEEEEEIEQPLDEFKEPEEASR